jgi:hypothetical protein
LGWSGGPRPLLAFAVEAFVTRSISSELPNFATHSPEDSNMTENTVLRASNGPS